MTDFEHAKRIAKDMRDKYPDDKSQFNRIIDALECGDIEASEALERIEELETQIAEYESYYGKKISREYQERKWEDNNEG